MIKKLWPLFLLCSAVASAQKYYDKTTIQPGPNIYSDASFDILSKGIFVTNNVGPSTTYTPGTAGQNSFYGSFNLTGASSNAQYSPMYFSMGAHGFVNTFSSPLTTTVTFVDGVNGATNKGDFGALYAITNVVATTANSTGAGGNYAAGDFVTQASVNDNGTGTGSNARGHMFGINPNVRLLNGATWWGQLVGEEIDVAVATGASVNDVIGMQIVQGSNHAVSGSRDNIGISFNGAAVTPGWALGVSFGNNDGYWPMAATGTLIGCTTHDWQNSPGVCGTTANGVDLSNVTLTTSAFKSSGFSVDGSGNVSGVKYTSTVATGTAPLVVASTTNVANLNASSLSGATFAAPGAIGGTTPAAGTFTSVTLPSTSGNQIPVVQWNWGIPVGLAPSGFFANNGVYVIGQAPSSSATASFSATSGSGVTMTMSGATLLGTSADVGRVLTILDTTYKYATITAQSSTTVATVTLTGTLSGTGPFANASIWLSGTPTTNTTAFSVPLPIAFPQMYSYLPANAVVAAVQSAGVYYATCQSTTVCTFFNNTLSSGKPTIPGSPTAFSTTGPGAFTQSGSTQTLLTLSIPANSLGTQGSLVLDEYAARNSNTDTITWTNSYGGTSMAQVSAASVIWYGMHRTIRNTGATNAQTFLTTSSNVASDVVTNNTAGAVASGAIDTTSAQNVLVRGVLQTAQTDYFFVTGGTITTTYSP